MTDVPPLKVTVISQHGDTAVGGAERYISEVSKRLRAGHGFELDHLTSESEALPPGRLRFGSSSFHPAWRAQVRRYLRATGTQVVYVHHTVPGLTDAALRAARDLALPAALMYHGDVTGSETVKRLLGSLYHTCVGRVSLAIPAVTFASSAAYAASSPTLGGRPVVAAPPGVDPVMLEGERRPARPYVLFVGKPEVKSKGLDVLLAAWQQLTSARSESVSAHPDWAELELVVAGGRTKQRRGRVRYIGQVSSRRELADLYASAQVTVLPSTSSAESFGMVLAEALLAGCPIVGSKIGGVPTLIEHGKNGYLAPPGDPNALARALGRALLQQDALRSHLNARRRAYAELFSWDRTAATVAATLRRLASRGATP